MAPKRCLIVVRLSNLSDATSSPERQLRVCQDCARSRGWDVVGLAEDLDVSASVTSPFERPSLRPWLERPADYDVILVWRVDRVVRKMFDLADLIRWGEKHAVSIVSATESYFDTSSEFGQVIAMLVSMFAQMESSATRERTKQTYEHNIKAGKYRGGHPPFGYTPVKIGNEWRLQIDPVTGPLAQSIIERVLDGERLTAICAKLNQEGVPTPTDHFRATRGKDSKGTVWRTGNLGKALRSPTLLGHIVVTVDGEKDKTGKVRGETDVLREPDGTPLVRAEPLIDRVTFDRLQKALDDLKGVSSPYKKSEALLLAVLECGKCGRRMYLKRGRGDRRYYSCSSASYGLGCGNHRVRAVDAEEALEKFVLKALGDNPRMRREYDPGEDVAAEVAEIDAQLTDITKLIGTAAYRLGTPNGDAMLRRVEKLQTERDALAAVEYRPAGYKLVPTGETVAEHWTSLDNQERNLFLRDAGVRMLFDHTKGLAIGWDDLAKAVGSAMGAPASLIDEYRSIPSMAGASDD